MRMRGWLLLYALLWLPAPVQAADILGVAWDGVVSQLDASDGTGQTAGSSGFSGLNSLARSSAGEFFSVAGDAFASTSTLISIDPLSGLGTSIATVTLGADEVSVRGLAFSPGDVLYAVNNGGGKFSTTDPDALYTIDRSTGTGTLIGSTGFAGIQALAFAPDGTLYGWDLNPSVTGAGLVIINPLTGTATDVDAAVGEGGVDIQSVTFAPDGTLYGGRNSLYTIDPSSGSTSLVGSGGYADLRGIEWLTGPTRDDGSAPGNPVVPEAASWLLFSAGLVGLVGWDWGRRVTRYRR